MHIPLGSPCYKSTRHTHTHTHRALCSLRPHPLSFWACAVRPSWRKSVASRTTTVSLLCVWRSIWFGRKAPRQRQTRVTRWSSLCRITSCTTIIHHYRSCRKRALREAELRAGLKRCVCNNCRLFFVSFFVTFSNLSCVVWCKKRLLGTPLSLIKLTNVRY